MAVPVHGRDDGYKVLGGGGGRPAPADRRGGGGRRRGEGGGRGGGGGDAGGGGVDLTRTGEMGGGNGDTGLGAGEVVRWSLAARAPRGILGRGLRGVRGVRGVRVPGETRAGGRSFRCVFRPKMAQRSGSICMGDLCYKLSYSHYIYKFNRECAINFPLHGFWMGNRSSFEQTPDLGDEGRRRNGPYMVASLHHIASIPTINT